MSEDEKDKEDFKEILESTNHILEGICRELSLINQNLVYARPIRRD